MSTIFLIPTGSNVICAAGPVDVTLLSVTAQMYSGYPSFAGQVAELLCKQHGKHRNFAING